MNKKALIIDLDGTLLDANRMVSDYNIMKVNECFDEGYCVIIATARPYRSVKELLPANLNISYFILCNGAWIVRNKVVISRNEMDASSIKMLCDYLIARGYKPAIEADDSFFTDGEKDPGFIGQWYSLNEYDGVDACKVLAYKASGINAGDLTEISEDKYTCVITDNGTLLQISRKDCTKLAACEYILSLEGIGWKNTFAFCDDNNDLPVFEKAGFAIAMENATDCLKRKAKWVTESNLNNGVGVAIEKIVKGKALLS